MDLNEVAIFIKVIQAGSFSKAARELNIPKSTVSMKVTSLEKRLGLTLIKRTTRKLLITPAGEIYFKQASAGIEQLQRAENELQAQNKKPQGRLRITAPVDLGNSLLSDLVSAYVKKYPNVQVELLLTDRRVDLLGEGIDLAIRAGHLQDSSLIAKKVGEVFFAIFAAPKYLQTHSPPQQPKDLSNHPCIMFTSVSSKEWALESGKKKSRVPLAGKIIVNDIQLAHRFALSGEGLCLLPNFLCHNEVKSGKLVRVLADWQTEVSPIHFVYPAQRFVPPALNAFIQMSTDSIRQKLKL